jgi:hypothetical protein
VFLAAEVSAALEASAVIAVIAAFAEPQASAAWPVVAEPPVAAPARRGRVSG